MFTVIHYFATEKHSQEDMFAVPWQTLMNSYGKTGK